MNVLIIVQKEILVENLKIMDTSYRQECSNTMMRLKKRCWLFRNVINRARESSCTSGHPLGLGDDKNVTGPPCRSFQM